LAIRLLAMPPQPRTEVRLAVEPVPLPERGRERLRHQITGEGNSQASPDVGVKPWRVAAEQPQMRNGKGKLAREMAQLKAAPGIVGKVALARGKLSESASILPNDGARSGVFGGWSVVGLSVGVTIRRPGGRRPALRMADVDG
jgi:hypothetical protein